MFKTIEEYGDIGVFRCGELFIWDNDIFVTINFTSLSIASTKRTHLRWQSALVMLGFTNDTEKTVLHTRPSFLVPGIDLFGISQLRIQKTFKNNAFSAFGLFDVHSTIHFNFQTVS